MTTAEKLQQEIEETFSGQPWYGDAINDIIDRITFETAYEKPPGSVHNIAEIVLHMIAWTEEVIDRLNEKSASMPVSGDWPETGAPNEQKWQNYVDDLKLVNVNLISAIQAFPPEKWEEKINDDRGDEPATYEGTVRGLIQHQVYHAGQIALLIRIIQIFE